MPVWPKSFHWFGLSLKTAATEWKLRQRHDAPRAQDRALRALLPLLAAGQVWRQAGITAGMSYAEFQKKIPLSRHDHLAPAIERMKAGEPDVLAAGRCALFVRSAGTQGEAKHLPLTEPMLAHFRRAWLDALLYYTVRVRHAGVFRGRHLLCGGSTALRTLPEASPHLAYATELTGVLEVALPRWAEKHYYEPPSRIAQIPDWPAKLEAIATRTVGRDISLLAGTPNWTLDLIQTVREIAAESGRSGPHLQALWPNLECFVHHGVPVGPHQDELRALLGPGVKFHEVYLAPEGLFAAQDGEPVAGLRVLADAGVFFEFLPMSDYDEARLPQLGARAVPLGAVRPDVDYALIVTTPAGLARIVVGDIVRFTSVQPPRFVYAGRTTLRLDAFGEVVIEKELTDALVTVCRRRDWAIVNFHVAPLFAAQLTGQKSGRHEWWVELKPGTIATPTGPQMAMELDAELTRVNPDYAARRKTGVIDAPFVRLVMPGVFQHWLTFHGRWGGEHKLARCRRDRLIADQLAQVTNFARD